MIFKQTLEVNRIPPVRTNTFHHHYVYLSGGGFLSSMNLNALFLKPFNIRASSHRRHHKDFVRFQKFLMSKKFHLLR